MREVGTEERPLRVAIIGAGPSGFYAAGALLQNKEVVAEVDMFDRLPAPHGLVRYGVAPDHPKIKSVSKLYDRTAASERFRFFGNVNFGTDITLDEMHRHYDQIIFATGAQTDRHLNIPGEDLQGSLSATEFVAWYNSHPDYVSLDVDLSVESAVVVGVGNVAMDVARILAKSADELAETDIADHALEKLTESNIKDIYVIARRGPAQAKFTPPEIKEFGELEIAEPVVHPEELQLDAASAAAIEGDSTAQRNMAQLEEFAERESADKPRRVHFLFLRSPVELIGEDGKVVAVRIEKNRLEPTESDYINAVGTGEFDILPAGLVLRAVGYRGVPLPGVPYNERRGIIPNTEGRVMDPESGEHVDGLYVVGWAKRGPTGVIGTNKPDATETVDCMVADLDAVQPAPEPDPECVNRLLEAREVRYVSMEDWQVVDASEIADGKTRNKPRVKVTTVAAMLDIIEAARRAA
jgi:ferredoxin--NADP+ reductase